MNKLADMFNESVAYVASLSPKEREILSIRGMHCEWCSSEKYGHLFMVNPYGGGGSRRLLFDPEKLAKMSMDELEELYAELEENSPYDNRILFDQQG